MGLRHPSSMLSKPPPIGQFGRGLSGNRFDRMEWAGAFGDLGTLIPFVVAYIAVLKIDPLGILFSFGAAMVVCGFYYKTPFPVQPMKAIGAVAATQAAQTAVITQATVYGASLVTGMIWLILGLKMCIRDSPERVLIVGLGGGSLVKYCHRHLQTTQVTTVEIDADVIALRSQFFVPPDDERLKVVHADGAEHVAAMVERGERTDAILVDAYDHTGIAKAVVEPSFIENAKKVLGTRGVFVMNLVAELGDCKKHVETIRCVFGDPVLVIAMQCGGNFVVFAGQALCDRKRVALVARTTSMDKRQVNT